MAEMKATWRVISREGERGRVGGKVEGIRRNGRDKIGEIKNRTYRCDPWT